jgi:hypothetical protein
MNVDAKLLARIRLNHERNRTSDHGPAMRELAERFDYASAGERPWSPEHLSLLYGTPLYEQASASERLVLNHLFWVAYHAQIISAEIATIYFNQTSAAGLYGIDELAPVCSMLDLESTQEREHIHAFKTIAEAVEDALFGHRVFTYPMRGPFAETMIFPRSGPLRRRWKAFQLRAFGLLSAGSAFIASQYFLIRGLRTLNGKMVQRELSRFAREQADPPIPSQVAHLHFLDESFHFNSSTLIGVELGRSLATPTAFERAVVNRGVDGCQRDHEGFCAVVPGLFHHAPASLAVVYRLLRTPRFGCSERDALAMLDACYGRENEGIARAHALHCEARASYAAYVANIPWLDRSNREMQRMGRASIAEHLRRNQAALRRFRAGLRTNGGAA